VGVSGDSGVGEDDVEATFFLFDQTEQSVKVGWLRDVSLDAADVLAYLLNCSGEVAFAPATDKDIRTFDGELFCCCKTDAAIAARYERDLSIQFAHTVVSPCSDPA